MCALSNLYDVIKTAFLFFSWYYEFTILFNNGQAGTGVNELSLFGVTNLQIKVSYIRDNQLNGNFICRTRIVENGASFDESAATRVNVDQSALYSYTLPLHIIMYSNQY